MDMFIPINEFLKKDWPRHQTRKQWVATFRNLDSNSITWKAPWMSRKSILYGCGDKLWILLLRLWGIVNYTPLLGLRQFGFEQFIQAIHGLNQMEFNYKGPGYVNQLLDLSRVWKEPKRMDLGKHVSDIASGYSA